MVKIEDVIKEAKKYRWSIERFAECVDELIRNDLLESPWCFKVKGSAAGDYWILSDDRAKKWFRNTNEVFFTLEELKTMLSIVHLLEAKVIKIRKMSSSLKIKKSGEK